MQTSYALKAPQAVLGLVSEDFDKQVQTVIPSATVACALLVCADLTSGKPFNYAKLPASAADIKRAIGVIMQDFTREGGVDFAANRAAPAVREGRIWVKAEGAITRWAPVFVRHTANGGLTQLGGFRADDDSGHAALLEGAISLTDAADGELFMLEVDLMGPVNSALLGEQSTTFNVGTVSMKASDNGVLYFPAPKTGTISAMKSVLNGALATADATLQLQSGANVGALANTGSGTTGKITATQAGSAAGDVDSCSPATTNVAVNEGDLIKVVVGGGSTATSTATVSVTISY